MNMSNPNTVSQADYSIGDAAVDGLLNGVIAGVGMGLYMLLVFLLNAVPASEILTYFSSATTSPLIGILIHLAISGVYGVVFGLVYSMLSNRWSRTSSLWIVLISGLVYGTLLWLLATSVLLRGSVSVSNIPEIHLLVAHLIFGILLGLQMGRSDPIR